MLKLLRAKITERGMKPLTIVPDLDEFKDGIPEAITGATVSSEALIDGVNRGIDRFKEYIQ